MAMKRTFEINGLYSFVKGLIGNKVYIELRAGTFAIGTLQDCDQYLNLRIRDAVILRPRKEEQVDEFFVCGRHIRYIHLAHYVDANEAIRKSCSLSEKKACRTTSNRTLATKKFNHRRK